MVSPAAGKVVLVPFPFSDLSRSKLRPAVVLADASRGDWVLCQVTGNPYGDAVTVSLTEDRRFTEVDLRTMFERATSYRPDLVEGRWVILTRHRRHP